MTKQSNTIEAILFAAGDEGVESEKLCKIADIDIDELKDIISKYNEKNSGIKLIQVGGKFQMCTREEYGEYVQQIVTPRIFKPLSSAAVEVLAIIAYKQPITRQVIEKIRGVESKFSLMKLLERDLIEETGRLDAPGRPLLYGTTDLFLKTFGFSELNDLPPLDAFTIEGISIDAEIEGVESEEEIANVNLSFSS
jgi:segregation and condensation protein B